MKMMQGVHSDTVIKESTPADLGYHSVGTRTMHHTTTLCPPTSCPTCPTCPRGSESHPSLAALGGGLGGLCHPNHTRGGRGHGMGA